MSQPISSLRAMRGQFRSGLKRGLIAALDIGTSKTCAFVIRVDGERLARALADDAPHEAFASLRVVGAGVTRSRGMRLSEVVDIEEACRAIRTALEIAEKTAGERVDHAVAALSGARPLSEAAHGGALVEDLEVSDRDVARAVAACRAGAPEDGRALLHAQPVSFELDGSSGLADPRGLSGSKLGCDMHIVSVAEAPLRNLAQCVRRADLSLSGVVCAPYASALSCLVEDEQKLGAACIDLGAGSTGVSIFLRGHLIHADAARIGGEHVTLDIANGLGAPRDSAERMKTLHGAAIATSLDDREMIEAPQVGEEEHPDRTRRRIPRTALIGVIRPRLEEILETARDRLREAGFDSLPGRRIVLTGGGAQLPGLEEEARRILGRRVRIGRPLRVAGLAQNVSGPAFAASVGLAVYAARPQDEAWDFETPLAPSGRGRLHRAMRWFRDNW